MTAHVAGPARDHPGRRAADPAVLACLDPPTRDASGAAGRRRLRHRRSWSEPAAHAPDRDAGPGERASFLTAVFTSTSADLRHRPHRRRHARLLEPLRPGRDHGARSRSAGFGIMTLASLLALVVVAAARAPRRGCSRRRRRGALDLGDVRRILRRGRRLQPALRGARPRS